MMLYTMSPSPPKPEFGLIDYWRMFRAKGARLPLHYFFQAHAFDLIHGTDTHRGGMTTAQYWSEERAGNRDMPYRCSWTGEIRIIYRTLRKNLGSEFEKFSFIDIGCGKGKVALAWALALRRDGLRQRLVGIDCSEQYVELAKANQRAMGLADDISFVCGDAARFDYAGVGGKIIAYLYNPFDGVLLRQVLARLEGTPSIIVYNNPAYVDELYAAGYKMVWRKDGWHPNVQTQIFCKSKSPAVFRKNMDPAGLKVGSRAV